MAGRLENPELVELAEFRPQWCLYWGGAFAKTQFTIWEPYLRRSRYRFLVFVDGAGAIPTSVIDAAAGMNNVAFAHSGWSIQHLRRVPSLHGILYVGNRRQNFTAVQALPKVAHVFIGHGHSAKRGSAARVNTLYDAVFLASYDDLARFPRPVRQRIRPLACAIGAPIAEGLEARTAVSATVSPCHPRVLYMPTWEGYGRDNYTSLKVVLASLHSAPPTRIAEFSFRPHPGTGTEQEELRAVRKEYTDVVTTTPGPVLTKAAAMNRTDVGLCDISGVTSEFLFTRKPVVLAWGSHLRDAGLSAANVRKLYPYAYVWDVEHQSLDEAVHAVLADDQLAERRHSIADAVFRGHRTLEEAVRTFDVALSVMPWRRLPIWPRALFEAKLSAAKTGLLR